MTASQVPEPRASTPLTSAEARALSRQEHTSRLTIWILGIGMTLVLLTFIVLSWVMLDTARTVRLLAQRNDCRSQYSSLIDERRADALYASEELNAVLGDAVADAVSGVRASPEFKDAFNVQRLDLESKLAAARQLPHTVHGAVEHGFTADGKDYPACPKT